MKRRSAGKTSVEAVERQLSTMNVDEMNSHLIEFVRDVRKPNGERYRPDVLLYFIYGNFAFLFFSLHRNYIY